MPANNRDDLVQKYLQTHYPEPEPKATLLQSFTKPFKEFIKKSKLKIDEE